MNLKTRILLFLALSSTLGWGTRGWADAQSPESHFSQVQGTVKVFSSGGTVRKVTTGDAAYAGETVQVGSKAQAQLTLFDGSTLDLSPRAKITLTTLLQPSPTEKILSFKLALGKVFAQVKKLMSAKSSFEIEAGGVVCGVRGTAFSMDFDPKTNKLDLDVLEGRVGATSGGNTLFFNAGQGCHFVNGQTAGTGGGSSNGGSKNGGKGGSTGGSSNGNSNGSGGGNSGSNSNGGSTNNASSTGSSTGNNGGANGTGNGNPEGGDSNTGNPPNNVGPGNTTEVSPGNTTGVAPTSSLDDLNNCFTTGILINGDNSLTTAQQNVNIHLVVPGREAAP